MADTKEEVEHVQFQNPAGVVPGQTWFVCDACIKQYEIVNAGNVRKTQDCDICGRRTLIHAQMGHQLRSSKKGAEAIKELPHPKVKPIVPKKQLPTTKEGDMIVIELAGKP